MMNDQPNHFSPRLVKLKVYSLFKKRKVFVKIHVIGEADLADGAMVELQLIKSRSGEVLGRKRIRNLLSKKQHTICFSMSGLDSACYFFRARIVDRYGTHLPCHVLQDRLPGEFPWMGAGDGVSRKVPFPWEPLGVRSAHGVLSVHCWGRRYEFDSSHFIRNVFSDKMSMVTAPVRLLARVDGQKAAWSTNKLRVVSEKPDRVVFERELSTSKILLRMRTEVEFDGMIRIDWILFPRKPVRLESLVLEIPVNSKFAKYFYYFPGKWGGVKNVGSLPVDGMRLGFRPFIWLGDEERGLAWFAESDENWFNASSSYVTDIQPAGNQVKLRLHIVSSVVNLVPKGSDFGITGFGRKAQSADSHTASQLHYSFGFQATPVKPIEKDAWDYRIFCINQVTPGFKPRLRVSSVLLDKLVKHGVRTVVIFEQWTDAEGHVVTPYQSELKKIVNACHERGLKVLLYFSFLISDLAPEWRDFGKECIVVPKGGYPVSHFLPQPDQSAWRVCLRSSWQDFLVSGIRRAMDEFAVDGVYLDGTEYPFDCCNTEHGCGVLKPDGSIAPTYPIFAVRSAMRRIYHVVRSRKPDGQLNVHNSTCMTIPTLGWATSYWDGEQFQNVGRGRGIHQLLPLEAFRGEFMGHPWGVSAEFLCYGRPFTFKEAWSFCLLHDVPVRPNTLEPDLKIAASVWSVMDRFGRQEAEWLPYWRNAHYVTASHPATYVSLYRHAQNGVLMVLSNLSKKRLIVDVHPDMLRLGFQNKKIMAQDAITDRTVQLRNGRIRCSLNSFGWKLIWVKPLDILLSKSRDGKQGHTSSPSYVEVCRSRWSVRSARGQPSRRNATATCTAL